MAMALLAIDTPFSRPLFCIRERMWKAAHLVDDRGPNGRRYNVRKEFIVERQGRSFCLYAGLLDLAHQQGLKSIRTELIQAPSDANNRVAICSATVTMESDGVEKQFTGIGDAAPNNVAPAMQTCLLRMAETRAKARAMRDAVNIGVAAFEELGDEDAHDGAPERGYAIGPGRAQRQERPAPPVRSNGNGASPARTAPPMPSRRPAAEEPPTAVAVSETAQSDAKEGAGPSAMDSQLEAIRKLCQRNSIDSDTLAKERFNAASLPALTQAQAGELIRELNGRPAARTPAAA